PPDSAITSFSQLGLKSSTIRQLERIGYETPSPIQAAFIPVALTGKDCIGQARTGTGKTAAFMLPSLEQIDSDRKRVQMIVLAPTRELSEQVYAESKKLGGGNDISFALAVGGRPIHRQIEDLRGGAQVLIGTPGR
ncbi:MAG: DEAD/DEAH box helicase, partial [Phycisphaerae bacterium]